MNHATATAVVPRATTLATDSGVLAKYLDDAAHYPGGNAAALARPRTLEEVVWVVQHAPRVLAVGAQSSLTGGATPAGDVVLSTERLTDLRLSGDRVVAGAGVTLVALQEALAPHGLWFPPVPTYLGATVGGAVATNAAGAATFKYGAVRRWVEALTVVLDSGDVLRLRRGLARAERRQFVLMTTAGTREISVPDITMPNVPKCSAGYFSAPDMDLVDLFIGAEGTLGVIVDAELRCQRRPAGVCWIRIMLGSEDAAIALTGDLRDQRVLDVAAIEHIDGRAIELLREDGVDTRLGIDIPRDTSVILLAQVETDGRSAEDGLDDASLAFLADLLAKYDAMDTAEIVLPSAPRRAAALIELREAVPAAVNRRVAHAHAADRRIYKTAADMIVPFARFADMMRECRTRARHLHLDLTVWGHISDGNVHPNVIPRTVRDVEKGRELILELAAAVVEMGGSPLAEHGVGRNPVKQRLLRQLYGEDGVDAMRRVKRAFDPQGKFGVGLLFEEDRSRDAR